MMTNIVITLKWIFAILLMGISILIDPDGWR